MQINIKFNNKDVTFAPSKRLSRNFNHLLEFLTAFLQNYSILHFFLLLLWFVFLLFLYFILIWFFLCLLHSRTRELDFIAFILLFQYFSRLKKLIECKGNHGAITRNFVVVFVQGKVECQRALLFMLIVRTVLQLLQISVQNRLNYFNWHRNYYSDIDFLN